MNRLFRLSSLVPVDRRRTVLELLAQGIWCPRVNEGESVEDYIKRLAGIRAQSPQGEVLVCPGHETDNETHREHIWRASGWAQQQGLVPFSLGRDFCRYWCDEVRFDSLVDSEIGGRIPMRLVPLCERVEIVFLVPNGEVSWPITHIFTTGSPAINFLSPRDEGVLETLAFQIVRTMHKRGSGAGLVALDILVAYGSPGSEACLLPESGRAVRIMRPRFTMSAEFLGAVNEHRRVCESR